MSASSASVNSDAFNSMKSGVVILPPVINSKRMIAGENKDAPFGTAPRYPSPTSSASSSGADDPPPDESLFKDAESEDDD